MKLMEYLIVGGLLGLAGCSSVSDKAVPLIRGSMVDLGIFPKDLRPLVVDVLVDGTEGSPGRSPDYVRGVVDGVLPSVVVSEGSVRGWILTVEGAVLAGSFVARPVSKPGTPARRAHLAAETARARSALAPVIAAGVPGVVLSRLFAAVTRIAGETTDARAERRLVLLSDLRTWDARTSDASGVDWECGEITPLARLSPLLDREQYLVPGSMASISVQVLYFTPSSIGRCPGHETARYTELQSRWTALLHRAGATVEFRTAGLPANSKEE